MSKSTYRLQMGFPVFCLASITISSDDDDDDDDDDHSNSILFAGGGGGSSKSGVKNKIAWFTKSADTGRWQLTGEMVVSDNTGAVMCMAVGNPVDKQQHVLACGLDNYCVIYAVNFSRTKDSNRVENLTLKQLHRFRSDFKETSGPYDESYQRVVRFSNNYRNAGGKLQSLLLATGGTDGVPRLWTIGNDCRKLHEFPNIHQDEITDLAFYTKDSLQQVDNSTATAITVAERRLISVSRDSVAIIDAEKGELLYKLSAVEYAGSGRSYRSLLADTFTDDPLVTVMDAKSRHTYLQTLQSALEYQPTSVPGQLISRKPVSAITQSHHEFIVFGTSSGDVGFLDSERLHPIRLDKAVHGLPITALAATVSNGQLRQRQDDIGDLDLFTASADGSINIITAQQLPAVRHRRTSAWIFILWQLIFIVLAIWLYRNRQDYL